MMITVLVYVGLVLSIGQMVPYAVAVRRGSARPNVVSWATWTLLTGIGALTAMSGGNWRGGVVVLGNSIGTLIVVLLGLRHGYAGMGWLDGICQLLALAGLSLWPLLHTPNATVTVTIIVDAIAVIPTLRHAWRAPQEEAWITFILAALGSLCGLVVVQQRTFAGMAYLLYLFAADSIIALMVLTRRRAVAMGWNE